MRRKIIIHGLVIFFFLATAFAAYPDFFFHFNDRIPGGENLDAQLHLSIIDWTFSPHLPGLYHLPIFYPLAYMRAGNQPLLFQSAFFKAFKGLGLKTESSNNLYILLAWILGAYGCFLLCREFTSSFLIPLFFSSIMIVHQINFLFINWLNFMSFSFFPFILLFFIRHLKTKKEIYAAGAAGLLILQITASLFYGFFSWAFYLPLLLLASLVVGKLTLKEMKTWLLYALAGMVVLLFLFLPYLNSQSRLSGDSGLQASPADLITGESLFHHSKIWDAVFAKNPEAAIYYFPGFVFTFFLLSYFVSFIENKRRKYLMLAVLFLLSVLLTLLVYLNQMVLDYVFLLLLVSIAFLVGIHWKKIARLEKILILALFFYFLIFIYFPHIPGLKSFSLYSVVQQAVPFLGTGLRKAKRALFLLAPFMTVFAVLGAVRLFRFPLGKSRYKAKIAGLIFILIFMENIRPERCQVMMQPLPEKNPVYQKIPSNGSQVLLEIPFYYNDPPKNIRYMYGQKWHHNPLLNGKATWIPLGYMSDLNHILTPRQENFPTEQKLRLLIQNYSVTHVIFHWDLLKDELKDKTARKKIQNRVRRMKRFGRVIYDSPDHTILKLKEFFPVKRINRNFSLYHLQNRRLQVRLSESYTGEIKVRLNERFLFKQEVDGQTITLDLRERLLGSGGNPVSIIFDKHVFLEEMIWSAGESSPPAL